MRAHKPTPAVLTILFAAGGGWPAANNQAPYLSPDALAADPAARRLYIAEHTASSVAVFDLAREAVASRIPLADRPTGMVLSPDARRLFVTAGAAAGKVYVIDTAKGAVEGAIAAGYWPAAPVLSRDGKTLYVCNRYDSDVSVIDLASRAETARIGVVREPVAAGLSADGKRLFVANHLPAGPSNAEHVAAEVSVIETQRGKVTAGIRLPDGSSGVRGLTLSPDGRFVYVTHVLARYRLPASQIERGWIQTNAVSVIDAVGAKLLNSVLLDDINLGAANPWAVACTADGRYLVVSHAGTHEVSVIGREALHRKLDEAAVRRRVSDVSGSAADVMNDMAFLTGFRTRVPLTGNGPRALAVAGSTVYAGEYFSDSLGIVDLSTGRAWEARSVRLGDPQPLTDERRGEMLFHDAQYCLQKWLSCSSCHPNEARPDGLNWDLMLDGVGNPKNTKSLLYSHRTPPTTATGARANAEVSVRAGYRNIQFAERPEPDASAVDAYLKSLRPRPSPYLKNGKPAAPAERGRAVFQRAGCAGCHSGPYYTDMLRHDIGTGRGAEKGTAFDTPTLIELWRSAPYLHDGRAATLKDVLTSRDSGEIHKLSSRLTEQERRDLLAFLLSL